MIGLSINSKLFERDVLLLPLLLLPSLLAGRRWLIVRFPQLSLAFESFATSSAVWQLDATVAAASVSMLLLMLFDWALVHDVAVAGDNAFDNGGASLLLVPIGFGDTAVLALAVVSMVLLSPFVSTGSCRWR